MTTKASGFFGTAYHYSHDQSDEASMSSSSSPSEEHMAFASAPNVQIYIEHENAFLVVDELVDLADDLRIQNETRIKIKEKMYTIFTNDKELYISGINELADAYYLQEKEGDQKNIVYINCSKYSQVLKRVVMLFAQSKWRNLMMKSRNADSNSSCEKGDTTQAEQKLFHDLCQHSKCITNEDLVKIISSKKNWDIRVWTDLNSDFLKTEMKPERLEDFMRLLSNKPY